MEIRKIESLEELLAGLTIMGVGSSEGGRLVISTPWGRLSSVDLKREPVTDYLILDCH